MYEIMEEAPEVFINSFANKLPSEIAQWFKDNGYEGNRDDPFSCPLANCLSHKFKEEFAVSAYSIEYWYGEESILYTPPVSLAEFIIMFDNGRFPELDCNV